ncbi:MAG TPA: hypothetical protein PK594_13540 [Mycobacterium sp.]|nr:hypothetical protein [Mycobacterium sp.]
MGPPFEADDKSHAYDKGCALFGERCWTVQSVVSWETSEAERRAERRRPRPDQP